MADRRSAVRARHRAAIVQAAEALMAETGGMNFAVDELARRAEVSRRTIFNYFASVDDIAVAVCTGVLDAVIEGVDDHQDDHACADAPGDAGVVASIFEEVATILRTSDLVVPLAYLTRILGGAGPGSSWQAAMLVRVFSELSHRMSAEASRRHPHADTFEVELLVSTLIASFPVIHRHWQAATGAVVDDDSRRVLDGLLERLVEVTRHGYGRTTPPNPTTPDPSGPSDNATKDHHG